MQGEINKSAKYSRNESLLGGYGESSWDHGHLLGNKNSLSQLYGSSW